jgi:FkbM family methyltransferase
MKLVERATSLLRRRRNAQRIGVHFVRAKSFRLPCAILLNGHKIDLNISKEQCQITAFVEVLLDDCYRLREIARTADIATVLDIGANVGLFSMAARMLFPKSRVHAYEPNTALAHQLCGHARQAGFDFFIEAVGYEESMVSLVVDPNQSVLTSTRHDPGGGSIPQVAFRRALGRLGGRADLVKLDCEGAEWEIFEDRESWSRVRFVTMEYHLNPGDGHDKVADALRAIGFIIRHQFPATSFGLVLAEQMRWP